MFMGQSQLKALKRYAAVETDSRIEGATPHQLVRILFDELLLAIDASVAALRAQDRQKTMDKQTRALTILHALETSLDFQRGGDIALSLAVIYREARKRLLEGTSAGNPEAMEQARGYIAEIAEAWSQIGSQVDKGELARRY
ncbi:MAG: flagellar protein FliS [Sphingobium sp.]|nr:flagellar protein FliS [Sphingobium sp.]